ncbi:Mov34/MPN/PAD-1 family protein [Paenibacillus sp. HN-1]|uniref:Mov34/MPN/PAD-1 family protein n=1 Tax=Paenibacillus TaxID=44249 RepID=UPI001CA7BB65|nr:MULTISPECIES: Mov34/MPN/PAD-1 family protein [Paenibacillus]MBY9082471.1 Mov34/MPN/PAD-1 family protein [Paenibacillus sp. CGMCC 1.18879]MBY9084830.1 Mov34/MPN/PAD-1 family protein [Paenibacillus sinensis]
MTAYQGTAPTIQLKPSVYQALGKHLASSLPHEACGVLLGAAAAGGMRIDTYVPMRNVAPDPLHAFVPHPADWVAALFMTPPPIGLFHSHPRSAPFPSAADYAGLHGLEEHFAVYLIGAPGPAAGEPIQLNGYEIIRTRTGLGPLTLGLAEAQLQLLLK